MLPITLDDSGPAVRQIERQVGLLIERGHLKPGAQVPSVRQLAEELNVSTFTVVTAYDRLVSSNYLVSRRARGYFVAQKSLSHLEDPALLAGSAIDAPWLFRAIKEQDGSIKAGAGVLPTDWIDSEMIRQSARFAVRHSGDSFSQYPSPLGYRPLRDLVALKLIDLGISVQSEQVVTTAGASHAIDLTLRTLLPAGSTVLIEDPGYYTLFSHLEAANIRFATVPRRFDGIDIDALEQAVRLHEPKLLFLNSVLHNPTGSTLSTINAHKILGLAERYDFLIIEDDIYCDFYEGRAFRLANLDQLQRVIYVGSYAKTISPSLRVGFLAAGTEIARRLAARKLLTCLATSELSERIVAELLTSGAYRRHMERLRERLADTRPRVASRLRSLGFDTPVQTAGGFFLWGQWSDGRGTLALAKTASHHGLVLAPGSIFSPDHRDSNGLRLNIAHCDSAEFEARMMASIKSVSAER